MRRIQRLLLTLAGTVASSAMSLPSQVLTWKDTATCGPWPRRIFGMAYDATRRGVLVFGGYPDRSDTWLWNGRTWLEQFPSSVPPGRNWSELCRSGDHVLLFGGRTVQSGFYADTWEWDGQDWTQRSPATSPSPRCGQMAYDSQRRRIILFGGIGELMCFNDTWEWDGNTWKELAPLSSPQRRSGHAMAYDAARDRIVLFGGFGCDSPGGNLADTWEWDGTTWLDRTNSFYPAARSWHAMTYNEDRQRVVLFGGGVNKIALGNIGAGSFSDTWEWDGSSWTQPAILNSPGARYTHKLVYFPDRYRTVLFGGLDGYTDLCDTWDLFVAHNASYVTFGAGCAGSAGTPTMSTVDSALPWTGETMRVRLTSLPSSLLSIPFGILGFSRTTWGTIPLPLDLQVVGMPMCLLQVSMDNVFPLTNVGGSADWNLRIPDDPALVDQQFFQQGFVLDGGANALGAIVTNAGEATIGLR